MIEKEEKCTMIKLKDIRTKLNLRQNDIADQLHIKRNTVCDWELGKSEPSIERLKELSNLLSITVDMLLGHTVPSCSPSKTYQELEMKKQIKELSYEEQKKLLSILEKLEGRDRQCILE